MRHISSRSCAERAARKASSNSSRARSISEGGNENAQRRSTAIRSRGSSSSRASLIASSAGAFASSYRCALAKSCASWESARTRPRASGDSRYQTDARRAHARAASMRPRFPCIIDATYSIRPLVAGETECTARATSHQCKPSPSNSVRKKIGPQSAANCAPVFRSPGPSSVHASAARKLSISGSSRSIQPGWTRESNS